MARPAVAEEELVVIPVPVERIVEPAIGTRTVNVSWTIRTQMLELFGLGSNGTAGHDAVLRELVFRQNDLNPRQSHRVAQVGGTRVGTGGSKAEIIDRGPVQFLPRDDARRSENDVLGRELAFPPVLKAVLGEGLFEGLTDFGDEAINDCRISFAAFVGYCKWITLDVEQAGESGELQPGRDTFGTFASLGLFGRLEKRIGFQRRPKDLAVGSDSFFHGQVSEVRRRRSARPRFCTIRR